MPSENPTLANLADEYGSSRGTLTLPPIEVMLTIAPERRASMPGRTSNVVYTPPPEHNCHGALEVLDLLMCQRPHLDHTGVVDRHVDTAKVLDRVLYQAMHLVTIGDIADRRYHIGATRCEIGARSLQLGRVASTD
jgi:hypothetical protein